jgi:aminoglycoside 6'-N-acetyltransferase I
MFPLHFNNYARSILLSPKNRVFRKKNSLLSGLSVKVICELDFYPIRDLLDKELIMEKKETEHQKIRKLGKDEKIPYDLLLIADETLEAIDKYIFGSDIYVLEQENKIIAAYVLQSINKNEIEIKNIAVVRDCQGKGIGKLLLRDAAFKAKGKGFKTIIIGTGDASIKQLYLYQKEGFEVFDIKKSFFINNYPEPIYENGIQLKHMIMLKKELM